MKRLLVISYDFPPSPVGIWRTLKFCRYMPQYGWMPSVLTVQPVRSPRFDLKPLGELPAEVEIRRTESLDPHRLAHLASLLRGAKSPSSRHPGAVAAATAAPRQTPAALRAVMGALRQWVFLPDERMGWIPFAWHAGKRWMREQKFDAIYSTSFPHSAHVAAAMLARRSGVPLLVDFRDSWTGNYEFFRPATPLHASAARALEGMVVRTAHRVVSATGPITADFQRRYEAEPIGKFLTITNGFDDGDFPAAPPEPDAEHFTISYVGTLFGDATPAAFLAGVARLLEREPRWRGVLRLRFTGSMIAEYRAMIATHGLDDITTVEGYLPHDEALVRMASADMLLLLVPKVRGAEIMLTQKVFEYAAARRPILGLVPRGAARDFLTEINEGPILPPNNPAAVAKVLGRELARWQRHGRRVLPENPALARYHRRELTGALCSVLDGLK